MLKKRNKKQYIRLFKILITMTLFSLGLIIILNTFRDNIVFFVTPSEIKTNVQLYSSKKQLRLGGLVKEDSLKFNHDGSMEFIITDQHQEIIVKYTGPIPSLFKENSGAVVLGAINNSIFAATELLAKHDEKYIPKEIADSIKKSGQWRGDQ